MIIYEGSLVFPYSLCGNVHRKEQDNRDSVLPGKYKDRQPILRSAKPPGPGALRPTIEFHPLVDPGQCHKCRDKVLYCNNELIGIITRVGERWTLWRIRDYGRPPDRADLAMYEEYMEHLVDFSSLHDAKKYVRGPFSDMILLENELGKRKTD